MLNAVHDTLAKLLFERGLINQHEVDVRFEAPSKEWVESLTRPTVNMFLFELQENTEKRDGAPQAPTVGGGRAERRMPPRRIDLRYMVSVLTSDVGDEHELLWRVLFTLMKHQQYPAEVLPESLRTLTPPMAARLATQDEGRSMLDIWSALGSEPRPALCYIVTAPMDLAFTVDAPLVLTRTARYRRLGGPPDDVRVRVHIGGTVRNRAGQPIAGVTVLPKGSGGGAVTTAEGRYALHGLREGAVTLTVLRDGGVARTVDFPAPVGSYDIELDE